MKKLLVLVLICASMILLSCSHELSGQLVKDVKGNVYLVRKASCKAYRLDKIDSTEYKKLNQ